MQPEDQNYGGESGFPRDPMKTANGRTGPSRTNTPGPCSRTWSMFMYLSVLLLLALVVGCGGQAGKADSKTDKAKQQTTDQAKKEETTTTPEPPLALFPLGEVRREGADPGWQKASVEFGIRNDGSTPKDIQFPKGPDEGKGKGKGPSGGKDKGPGGSEGTISVEEGRTYDIKLEKPDKFEGFRLPPGFALCLMVQKTAEDSDLGKAEKARAESRIPQDTTPTSLSVNGYPQVDLPIEETNISRILGSNCKPTDTTSLPKEDSVTLRAGDKEATLRIQDMSVITEEIGRELRPGEPIPQERPTEPERRLLLPLELQNLSKLDDFNIKELRVWALGKDGSVRSHSPYMKKGERCDDRGGNITLGPSQSANLSVCFTNWVPIDPVALVIQAKEPQIYEVVSASALTEEPTDAQQKEGPSAGSEKSAEAKQKKGSSADSGDWTMVKPGP